MLKTIQCRRAFESEAGLLALAMLIALTVSGVCAQSISPASTSITAKESQGVFIGIGDFDELALPHLDYAQRDALAVRDAFVGSLKSIAPANARLLVSDAEAKDRPTRANIQEAITSAAREAGPNGVLIVYLSTHGLEGGAIAQDSHLDSLGKTGLALEEIKEWMADSPCPQRLLAVDACREFFSLGTGTKGADMESGQTFALSKNAHQDVAVLMSCSMYQVSYEMKEARLGVFTRFLLDGLNGGAPAGSDGFLRLKDLADWIKPRVERWSRERGACGEQTPEFDPGRRAGEMPLGAHRD